MLTSTQETLDFTLFAPEALDPEPENEGEWVVKAGKSKELPERFKRHGLENETRYIKPPLMPEIPERYLCYEKAERLASEINLPGEGSRHYALINGTFIFGDFIEALLVTKVWQVKTMTISTLSMSENNVDSLANLIEGDFILDLNLIVSDYFFSHERQGLIPYIYERLDQDDKFQLAVAGTHCKLCIFETTCGKKITIHGSANLRSSANIEQFMVEWNSELYDFNHTFQQKIIDRFKTINKPIRHSKLWDVITS